MRSLALALALASSALALAAADGSQDTLGKGFIMAQPGQTCTAACGAAGKRAAVFRHLDTETALCAVLSKADGWTPGWQMSGSGNATCAATAAGVRQDDGSYSW